MVMEAGSAVAYASRHASVSTRRVEADGSLLFHADSGRERLLNATGAFVWDRLDGTRGLDRIANEVTSEFDGISEAEAAQDVVALVAALAHEGLAESSAGPRGEPLPEVAKVADEDAPREIDISITGQCNAACTYCFYADEMERRPDLPASHWLAFFAELGELAVRRVCLSGGEVFTHPDLWTLLDGIVAQRMRFSLLTNGTLITDTTIARLDAAHRRARLDSVQVSIDGSCAEIHDACRGKGSFAAALRGLRLLKQAGFPVTCRVTITPHNVDDLERIAELLLEDVGLASFGTNDAVEMGSCRHANGIRLSPELERAAMLGLARLERRYPGRVTAMAGPLARWRMFRAMETARSAGTEPTPRMGRLTACGCVFNKLAVNHDGTITPCNMLATMVMGRIGETPIRPMWQAHPHLRALRERRQIPMDDVVECAGCEWIRYCNGSCPAVPFDLTGSLRSPNPVDCYRRFRQEVGPVPEP